MEFLANTQFNCTQGRVSCTHPILNDHGRYSLIFVDHECVLVTARQTAFNEINIQAGDIIVVRTECSIRNTLTPINRFASFVRFVQIDIPVNTVIENCLISCHRLFDSEIENVFLLHNDQPIIDFIRDHTSLSGETFTETPFMIVASLLSLLQHVLTQENTIQLGQDSASSVQTMRCQKVVKYINENLADHLCLELLASLIHTSPRNLIRIFQNEIGCTPTKYITKKRIHAAKTLLNQKSPVASVAQEVGYDSASYFCALFKRETGVTPAEFRATGN